MEPNGVKRKSKFYKKSLWKSQFIFIPLSIRKTNQKGVKRCRKSVKNLCKNWCKTEPEAKRAICNPTEKTHMIHHFFLTSRSWKTMKIIKKSYEKHTLIRSRRKDTFFKDFTSISAQFCHPFGSKFRPKSHNNIICKRWCVFLAPGTSQSASESEKEKKKKPFLTCEREARLRNKRGCTCTSLRQGWSLRLLKNSRKLSNLPKRSPKSVPRDVPEGPKASQNRP